MMVLLMLACCCCCSCWCSRAVGRRPAWLPCRASDLCAATAELLILNTPCSPHMRAHSTPQCVTPPAPPLLLPPPCCLHCRAYLESQPSSLLAASFGEWVRERRELKFLLSQLDLA